jgi:hypothetical protein
MDLIDLFFDACEKLSPWLPLFWAACGLLVALGVYTGLLPIDWAFPAGFAIILALVAVLSEPGHA